MLARAAALIAARRPRSASSARDRLGEAADVARRRTRARSIRLHHIGHAAVDVADDRHEARAHRLEQRDGKAFDARRQHEHVVRAHRAPMVSRFDNAPRQIDRRRLNAHAASASASSGPSPMPPSTARRRRARAARDRSPADRERPSAAARDVRQRPAAAGRGSAARPRGGSGMPYGSVKMTSARCGRRDAAARRTSAGCRR